MMTKQISRSAPLALMLSALVLAAGCSSDENTNDTFSAKGPLDLSVQANHDDICADPAQYDGRSIHLPGELIEESAAQTLVGCTGEQEEPCCGNSVLMAFTIPCGEDSIVLVAGAELDTSVAEGRVDYPAGSSLEQLIEGSSTSFGCVGQECALECTPAPAGDLASVNGTFRFNEEWGQYDSLSGKHNQEKYRLKLEVSDFELAE